MALRKDHHALFSSTGHRANGFALSLVALGFTAFAPTMAHAQTQDMFVSTGNNTISRFAGIGPGKFSTTATTFTAPNLKGLLGLAFDAQGDLFAANGGNSITEFASTGVGTFAAGSTFATGGSLNIPAVLAFDAGGYLLVANYSGKSITEFASAGAGTFGIAQTFASSLNAPGYIALSPSAPVPEASTTVSLGLPLALGMGGVVVARKRRRA